MQGLLDSLELEETDVAPGQERVFVGIYLTESERETLGLLGCFFGLGPCQIARILVIHGMSKHESRLRDARELGYALGSS